MPLKRPQRPLTQDPDKLSVTFIPYLLPPLASGEYRISASQTVKVGGAKPVPFESFQDFVVLGARYRLDPTLLNSQSPCNGARGDFSRQLPHPPSWLAVLLFDENDPPPDLQPMTMANLRGSDKVFFPLGSMEPGEKDTDPVTVIDVDIDLFNAIAPSLNDLRWNAHVRRVDPQAKASLDNSLPQLDYAVVVGNRLPAAGRSSVAWGRR